MAGVMMQYFHWYLPADQHLWRQVAERAADLAAAGFTALWLPPAYKGAGGSQDVGYAVYDMYDLGEFDQKGGVPTKYGTKDEFVAAVRALHDHGVAAYADVVLNHRMGADESEAVMATPYSTADRTRPIGPAREITAWTRFTFPGRAGAYSPETLDHTHFDAVDYDDRHPDERGVIHLLAGKSFDPGVATEFGNYAYLMGCDFDAENPDVRAAAERWAEWMIATTGVDGFRLDAVKHIASWSLPEWHDRLEAAAGREVFMVAEYWSNDLGELRTYLDRIGGRVCLFDVPLHFALARAAAAGRSFDLRTIFNGTLVEADPTHAVTFIENHDTQPLQALESTVQPWFKPHAHALILLRRDGYPCVFHADYYGADYRDTGHDGQPHDVHMPSFGPLIDRMLDLRHRFDGADQRDYFDEPTRIGWTRSTSQDLLAVVLDTADGGVIWMDGGRPGAHFVDALAGAGASEAPTAVIANADGWAAFPAPAGSIGLWVRQSATG